MSIVFLLSFACGIHAIHGTILPVILMKKIIKLFNKAYEVKQEGEWDTIGAGNSAF